MRTWKVVLIIALGILLTPRALCVLAAPSPIDPFSFFQPSVTVTAGDRSKMDDGHPVAHVVAGRDSEVGVWAAVPVNVDGDRLVAWMRRIEELKKSSYVPAIGRFSNPPRLDDQCLPLRRRGWTVRGQGQRGLARPGVRQTARSLEVRHSACPVVGRVAAAYPHSIDASRRVVPVLVKGKPRRQTDHHCHRRPHPSS
jgi:hypothetical protein